MKRLWAILAGAALVLWLSLMRSQGGSTPAATPEATHEARPEPGADTAAAAPAQPVLVPLNSLAAPAAVDQEPATTAVPTATTQSGAGLASDLIALPPRRDRPHFTAAQAREGSPGKILAKAYEREKADPAWSPDAQKSIHSVLDAAHLTKGEVFGVDCKRSLCKLQMRFSLRERENFDTAFAKLHQQFGTELGFEPLAGIDNHGQQVMRVYVMRQGKTLHDYLH